MIDRYALPEMTAIWSEEHKLALWIRVEWAVLQALAEEGIIPEQDWAVLEPLAERIDIPRLRQRQLEIEREVHHDVIAFLWALEEQLPPEGRWVHYGLTSSDIVDTAFSLQIQEAGDLLLSALEDLLDALKSRALEYKHQPIMGRTHGMYAEPTSLGVKFLSHYAEARRNRGRLLDALEGLRVGKLSGAVGTYTQLPPSVEQRALSLLGLRVEPVSTQIVPRDRHAHLIQSLALLASGLDRLAVEIRLLQRTEVGELEEPFTTGQRGSSAMPHKRNPIRSERLSGMARLLRGFAVTALENIPLWHERDISHSSAERLMLPDATGLVYYMLRLATRVVRGLVVYPDRIRENMEQYGRFYLSGRVLLALVRKGVARQEAYGWVKEAAHRVLREGGSFEAALQDHPEIASRLSREELREITTFDALKHVDAIFARVLGSDEEG